MNAQKLKEHLEYMEEGQGLDLSKIELVLNDKGTFVPIVDLDNDSIVLQFSC